MLDHHERSVALWVKGLSGIPGITAERGFPSEAGQPYVRGLVRIAPLPPQPGPAGRLPLAARSAQRRRH